MGTEMELIQEETDLRRGLITRHREGHIMPHNREVHPIRIIAVTEAVVQTEVVIPAVVIPAEVLAVDVEVQAASMEDQGK
jgi:hypothetical protein